jgi:hypothetical protein
MFDRQIPKPTILKNRKTSTQPISAEGARQNVAWLKQHYDEYQGQWIALNEGMLLGANKDSLELFKAIDQAGQLKVALFISLA